MEKKRIGDAGDRAFEQVRQHQETRNEILINYVQMLHFGILLVANLLTHVLPVAPFRAGALLLGLFATSLFARVAIFFYLRSEPTYSRWRKYLISAFDLAIFTASPLVLAMQGAYPWLYLRVFAVCIFTLLIVLAGLRYSRQVVVFNGVATAVLQTWGFPGSVSFGVRIPDA